MRQQQELRKQQLRRRQLRKQRLRRQRFIGNVISFLIGATLMVLIAIFGLIPAWSKQDENLIVVRPIEREETTILDFKEPEGSSSEEEVTTASEAIVKEEQEEVVEQEVEAEVQLAGNAPQVQTVSVEEEPYFPYTDTDIYLVGNTVFHEVGVFFVELSEEEAERAAYLTASCLVNRAKMNYMGLGRTIAEQVYSNQYQSRDKVTSVKEDYVYDRIYEIAEDVLKNGPVVSEKLIFQSEGEQGELVDQIGNQFFGILPESWD